jgi:hypothetical protein
LSCPRLLKKRSTWICIAGIMSVSNYFPYESVPLETASSIRLVRLHPSTTPGSTIPESIACELKSFSSDERPRYAALSYTWGSKDDTGLIDLNNKPCKVRRNLISFLLQKCLEQDEQWFWIDALCIDQTNIKERNHQVGMMSSIYSNVPLPAAEASSR